ncbi:MAG: hypothetical protein AAFX93_01590 [Verrucomicrobiota bacterium]
MIENADKRAATFRKLTSKIGVVSAASLQLTQELRPNHSGWIPPSRMVECVCTGSSVGGQSLVELLLAKNLKNGSFAAFVDLANGFDLDSLSLGLEERMLWVRCQNETQSLKALDLLLRDDNFSLVVADLRSSSKHLRQAPARSWYRLQRLSHQREGYCVILAQEHLSPCMDLSLTLSANHRFATLNQGRTNIQQTIAQQIAEQLDSPVTTIAEAI